MTQSIYDHPLFFARYLALRENPISLNEIIEKPTMFSLLPSLSGKRVLDLGCGAGEHLLHYLQQGAAEVVGLDLSQSMLNEAESQLRAQGFTNFALHHLSMEQLDRIDGQFDVITSSFAFHYVADFAELCAKIYTKLTACGTLVFSQEHPVTTCHKSGARWEKDAQKQQTAYRLNHYREEGERQRNWFGQPFFTYHRTLSTIVNSLSASGLILQEMREPMLENAPEWHAEFKDLLHRPPLLFVKAQKNNTP